MENIENIFPKRGRPKSPYGKGKAVWIKAKVLKYVNEIKEERTTSQAINEIVLDYIKENYEEVEE